MSQHNMKVEVLKQSGEKHSSKVDLNSAVFGIEPNKHCVYLAVKAEMASLRQGTSSSKTRAEVSGGGRKPWRQKGTGRARIGSTRNPAQVHGGVAFGPEPREYNVKINKKVRQLARRSALSAKLQNKNLLVVDVLKFDKPKTRDFVNLLDNLNLNDKKVTFLVNEIEENGWLSVRNLYKVNLLSVNAASTYDIVDGKKVLEFEVDSFYDPRNYGEISEKFRR